MYNTARIVTLQSVFESPQWQNSSAKLPLAVGRNNDGEAVVLDLARLPHLLIAGMTGSGKSVCMDSIILSLLSKFSCDELNFILADLKVVEFEQYRDIKHLKFPVLSEPADVLNALKWCVAEMNRRYMVLANAGCKTNSQYNAAGYGKMPYIIFVLDELSDVMLGDKKAASSAEKAICKICQRGRAAGIHLVISTQRPSKKVVTPQIAANIPSCIVFKMLARDGMCFIENGMTEQLEDSGDMIFMSFGNTNCQYVRGAFASEQTKSRIIDSVKSDSVQESDTVSSETRKYFREGDNQEFLRVLSWALEEPGKITPSYLQRVLEIGYNQAAEYMDILRERGVIPPAK